MPALSRTKEVAPEASAITPYNPGT